MTDSPLAIAVVGLGALFPGRLGTDGFWRDILDRRDAIREIPETHWLIDDYYDPDPAAPDKTYCKRGGFLGPVPFNPIELGLPPVALPSTDTAQILALVVARQVLAEASRVTGTPVDRSRTSVILGVASATEMVGHYAGRLARPAWIKGLREAGLPETQVQAIADRIASNFVPWTEASFPGLLGNVVAGRIANRLDLGGTNYVADAACASSLSALQGALRELHAGDSDLVITGGVDALNDILMFMCFSKTPAFSPTGDCRPFSDRADGTIIGEGVGMLALRRLADAERDGNRIYAVIRGLGSSSDGRATSVYAPRSQGQALALRRAYAQAGYAPSTVELVEAHGTGTVAGDAAEFASLQSVFAGDETSARRWCALGSVKSQIGHTKAAAGSAGLIKTVLALHHKILPPTIKIDRPNPELKLADSAFYLNTQPRPWIRRGDHPRRAAVSSFGFGGSNFHVTLEEYVGAPETTAARIRHLPAELVLLSASSPEALAEKIRTLASSSLPPGSLAQMAMTAAATFSAADPYRVAIVAADEQELRRKLDAAAAAAMSAGATKLAPGVHVGTGPAVAGRIAFLFPGQGSQYVNMGADLAMAFDICRDAWDRAAMIDAADADGEPLHRVVFPPPAFDDAERAQQEARLTAQEHAQPAIATVSLAHLAVLSAMGLRADCAVGHSFGEVMALHAAGAFDAHQAVAIAARRGRLMADTAAGRSGAMLAVPMSRDEVEQRLADWNSDLVVANDNTPEQVILSGPTSSIEAAAEALAAEQITSVRLPVASAFHSPTVAASQEPFEAFLRTLPFQPASIPVIANSTASPYPVEPDRQRALLAGQIARTVRFRESIERLHADGVRVFIEVGPGSVLTRLVSQTLGDRPHHAIPLDRRGHHGVVELLNAIGRLAALGVNADYNWLFRACPPRPSDAPARTPATIDILGCNYGKPYPPPGGATALPAPNVSIPDMTDTPQQDAPPPPRPQPPPPPPPQPAAAAAAPAAAGSDLAMLIAQVAETHRAFQQHMAAAHQSFLGMVERVLSAASPEVTSPAPVSTLAASPAETWMAPSPPPAMQTPPTSRTVRETVAPSVVAATQTTTRTSARETLLAIVSEKTGYPLDMLDLDMEIEASLGIDSIKQVEILSAFRERRPDLPEIAPQQLASLRTLGAIVSFADHTAAPLAPAATPMSSTPRSPAPRAREREREGISSTLLAIVSEKTGYPLDMLDLDMEIEASLGIDSIKQVEILSAFRERRPDLPEIAPQQLASLRTLGAIVAFAEGADETTPTAATPAKGVANERSGPSAKIAASERHAVRQPAAASDAADGTTPTAVAPAKDATTERSGPTAKNAVSDQHAVRQPAATSVAVRAGAEHVAATPDRSGSQPASRVSSVARQVLELVPAPPMGMGLPHLMSGVAISVVGGPEALREAVARVLGEHGVEAAASDVMQEAARGVIYLGALDALSTPRDAVRGLAEALGQARGLAQRLEGGEDGLFVTVQDTGGTFGIEADPGQAAWSAGLPALVKTLAAECPRAAVKAIDIARGDRSSLDLAHAIVDELLLGGPEVEIGLPDRQRRVSVVLRDGTSSPAAASGGPAVTDGQVVVVSGGARGVTAKVVVALARQARLRVLLLGRTPLSAGDDDPFPDIFEESALRAAFVERVRSGGGDGDGHVLQPREIGDRVAQLLAARETAATIAALTASGAEVRHVALDIRDKMAVARAVDGVRADWGPIAGVMHGAGVIADKYLRDKTDAQIERVLGTKLDGLDALLDATQHDPLAWLCLFSSAAARAGNIGQADYAVANEVLNKVARREARRRPDCVVKSVAWGPWDGGMVTPSLRDQFKQRGIPLIDMNAGAAFLVRELTSGDRAIEVVAGAGTLDVHRRWRAEVEVSAVTHPYLKDHVVHGRPVVPAVLLIEWCLRLARVVDPSPARESGTHEVHEVRDLNVVRPLALHDFAAGGVARFLVIAEIDPHVPSARDDVKITVTDRNGVVHCRATVVLHADARADADADADADAHADADAGADADAHAAARARADTDADAAAHADAGADTDADAAAHATARADADAGTDAHAAADAGASASADSAAGHRSGAPTASTPTPALAPPAGRWRAAGASEWPWDTREIYEGRLFHGSDFQVIRSLDGVSSSGAACTVVGVDEQGWPGGPWVTDPAALDGGFQLAAAWGVHQTGQRFLPTRVGRLRWIGSGSMPADGPLRCELTSRMVGRDKMISEIVLTTPAGQLVAVLDGLEMFTVDAATVTR